MPYFPDLNTYLHQSSLLIQAYPTTTRITTKYSLPRKPNPKAKSKPPPPPPATAGPPAESTNPATVPDTHTTTPAPTKPSKPPRERLPPSATLTLKTFEPGSGICLKYRTDKAAEVGRLLTGLGRLAGGEVIEMPAPAPAAAAVGAADKMEVDEEVVGSGTATPNVKAGEEGKVVGQTTAQAQAQQGGAGGGGGGAKGKKKRTGKK